MSNPKEHAKPHPQPPIEEELLHMTSAAWPSWTGQTEPSPDRMRYQVQNGKLIELK